MRKKSIHVILLVIGLCIVALLIRKVGFDHFVDILRTADKMVWILGLAAYFLSMVVRGFKWFMLARVHKPVPFLPFLSLYLVNAVIGNITPFKSGEAAAPLLMKKNFRIDLGKGFSILLLDRIFEILMLIVFLMFSFFYLYAHAKLDTILSRSIFSAAVLMVVILIAFLLVLFNRRIGFSIIDWLAGWKRWHWLKQKIDRIRDELSQFYQASMILRKKRLFFSLLFSTLLCWFAQFTALWLVVISVVTVDFLPSLVAQGIAFPVSVLSFIPAGLGITAVSYQYVMSMFGYPYDDVISAVLFSRVLFLALIFLSGMIATFYLQKINRE